MKYIKYYQEIMNRLMLENISFKMNTEKQLIEIGDVYVNIEDDLDDEAQNFSVGANLRETDFKLNDVDGVIAYIKELVEL